MNRLVPVKVGSLLATFLLTLTASCLAAAAMTADSAGASARTDRQARSAGAGKRSLRRTCIARVRERKGVGRRAAARICKRRAVRAPGARRPAPPTVAAVSTPAAAAPAVVANPAPATAAACAGATTVPAAGNATTVRAAVLCLVNAQRAANGLGALADNGSLTAAAQAHSDDMVAARYFSHTSLDGRSYAGRISAAGYGGAATAENIAWGAGGQSTPAEIVAGWMSSPGHRANILNASLSTSGIGVAGGTPTGASGATYTHDLGG
jgi:uncharacterized protein YkwD